MSLVALPAQPAGTPWPTYAWPEGPLPATQDRARFDALVDAAFKAQPTEAFGETHALVIVQRGRLVFEAYGAGFGPGKTYPSWSKAKSVTQALVGLIAADGKIDIAAPADVPEWSTPSDPRRAISLDILLRMSSGLAFNEDYAPSSGSDVIEMLYGRGKSDVAAFAAAKPLAHAPDTVFSYASGTTNIVARCAARALGADRADFERFMRARLFDPLGMTSVKPKFDAAGTFIGSSYCFASARDFARFGFLYLRGGVWEGAQLLPRAWIDYARTPTPTLGPNDAEAYGAHFWLGMAGHGSFSANGYDGQYTLMVPQRDLIIVRHGKTPIEKKDAVKAWIAALAATFPAA